MVDRSAKPHVAPVFDDSHPQFPSFARGQTLAAVIDDDYIEIRPRLPRKGRDALLKLRIGAQRGYDNRDCDG